MEKDVIGQERHTKDYRRGLLGRFSEIDRMSDELLELFPSSIGPEIASDIDFEYMSSFECSFDSLDDLGARRAGERERVGDRSGALGSRDRSLRKWEHERDDRERDVLGNPTYIYI